MTKEKMSKDFAVIMTGGKQYKVSAGDKLKIEKLTVQDGAAVSFDILLKSENGTVKIGTPTVAGGKAEAKVLRGVKDKTKIILK